MTAQFTSLLARWRNGERGVQGEMVSALYPELRAIAYRQMAGEHFNHTLQPTALVNEAYLLLSGLDRIDWQDRPHFVRVAARVMREILVDHARRRNADKRDGGERITLTNIDFASAADAIVDVVALDAALTRLEQLHEDKARVVELRFFGGLTIEETALALDISSITVKRHWKSARVWLFHALAGRTAVRAKS